MINLNMEQREAEIKGEIESSQSKKIIKFI